MLRWRNARRRRAILGMNSTARRRCGRRNRRQAMVMTHSAQLERETEQTRARVEQTLDELRARMSPGQLLDQATGYFRTGGGRVFVDNLRHQVVDNPLPVTL